MKEKMMAAVRSVWTTSQWGADDGAGQGHLSKMVTYAGKNGDQTTYVHTPRTCKPKAHVNLMECILGPTHGQQVGLVILSRLGRISASANSYRLDESHATIGKQLYRYSPKTVRLLQFRKLQKSRRIPGSPWYTARS